MDSIREKENELFFRWKQERDYKYFVKDGVFCPEQWEKESIKITFILKEANWENEDVDLREWIMSAQSPTYWKTWNNIARWTKALLEGGRYLKAVSKSDKTEWLSRISFMNLKKVGGDSSSDSKEIRDYAINDSRLLMEQIDLYKPDIIICCGRGNGKNADLLYENILPKSRLSNWQEPICGFNYFYFHFAEKGNRTPVVSFYHPQKIASHQIYESWYNSLVTLSEKLLPTQGDGSAFFKNI